MSAPSNAAAARGPGVGGTMAWVSCSEPTRPTDVTLTVTPHHLGRRVHQGIENHVSHVRENRDAQDESRQGECQGHALGSHRPHHRAGNSLDRTRVTQSFSHDGTEHDHHTDGSERRAEARFERFDEVVLLHPGNHAKEEQRHQQGWKDVPTPFGDEEQQENDEAQEGDQG